MEIKDNNAMKKVDDPRSDLGTEEQPKDPRNNLKVTKKDIGSILDLNFDDDPLRKLFITFKPFNLRIKIPENVLYIVMKSGIYIYLEDFQEARVFQKIYEKYPTI